MSTAVNVLGQTQNNGSQFITLVAAAVPVAINYTLSVTQSGATVLVPSNGASLVTITLPAVANAAGCNFKVIIKGAVAAGTVIVTTGTGTPAIFQGNSVINATPTPQIGGNTITFINTTVASSYVELFSDGVDWNFKALSNSNLAAAITLTTA